jgi:hypothetical protein
MRKIDILLLLVGPALQSILVLIFLKRKLYRQLPFFFSFLVAAITISGLRLSVIGSYRTYFKVFWITEAIYALWTLLVLHEVFRHVFSDLYAIWWWFRLVFPASVVIIAGLTINSTLRHPPAEAPPIISLVLSLSMADNYLQTGLFALLLLLLWLIGSGWEYYPLGITAGFAASTVGTWAVQALRSEFGTRFNQIGKYGQPAANFIAILIWLITFWKPRSEIQLKPKMSPEEMLEEVKGYLRALGKGLRKEDDSK